MWNSLSLWLVSVIYVILGQTQSSGVKVRVLLLTSTSVVRRHDGWMGTEACWRTLCLCHSSRQSTASGKLAVSNLLANIPSLSIIHGKSPVPKMQISLMYFPVETNGFFYIHSHEIATQCLPQENKVCYWEVG